jgi:hypothetical protein
MTIYNYDSDGRLESASDGSGKLLWKHIFGKNGEVINIKYFTKEVAGIEEVIDQPQDR